MIIINTHNPTGTIFSPRNWRPSPTPRQSRAFVLADEVYERLLYDGHTHHSIADVEGMRDKCVIVSSAAKTFNVTGWKTGWVLGCPEVVSAVVTAKQFLSYVGVTHVQPAVAVGLDDCADWVDAMAAMERRTVTSSWTGCADSGWTSTMPTADISWWRTSRRSGWATPWRRAWLFRRKPAWPPSR